MVKYIVIVVAVLLVLWLIGTYNKLVGLRNRVRNQWSQVDVQLKRRFDLIPNLVATVKGYAEHEKSIWEGFAKARQLRPYLCFLQGTVSAGKANAYGV